jgi:hypothetical protein
MGWGQGRECLSVWPPFSSSQALSLPSLLVGAVSLANPPLNMGPADPSSHPDLHFSQESPSEGRINHSTSASGLTGGQAVPPPALLMSKPACLTTPIPAFKAPDAKQLSWSLAPERAQDPKRFCHQPRLLEGQQVTSFLSWSPASLLLPTVAHSERVLAGQSGRMLWSNLLL